jgi:hypothetical protein
MKAFNTSAGHATLRTPRVLIASARLKWQANSSVMVSFSCCDSRSQRSAVAQARRKPGT